MPERLSEIELDSSPWKDRETRFQRFRDQLTRSGIKPDEATRVAAKKFPPFVEVKIPVPILTPPPPPAPLRPIPTKASELRATVPKSDRVKIAVFKGKSCSRVESIEWVASRLMISDTKPSDAPSSEAWAILKWAQRTQQNEGEFWKGLFRSIIPSRSEIEVKDKFKDDGREILTIIDDIAEKEEQK